MSTSTSPAPAGRPGLLVLCTGNAARSVMAGFMLEHLAARSGLDVTVATAGTHSVDGQPMSARTRAALATVPELGELPFSSHRSRQLGAADLHLADLVIAMEVDHVRFVRRRHPEAARRTATIRRLCRDLPPGPPALAVRVVALDLASAELGPGEDVADPAGGDQDAYTACAAELWGLCQELSRRL